MLTPSGQVGVTVKIPGEDRIGLESVNLGAGLAKGQTGLKIYRLQMDRVDWRVSLVSVFSTDRPFSRTVRGSLGRRLADRQFQVVAQEVDSSHAPVDTQI